MPRCASALYTGAQSPHYIVSLAGTENEVLQCAQLQNLANPTGVAIHHPYRRHLMVKEVSSGKIVATVGLMFGSPSAKLDDFECQSKFHLQSVSVLPARFLELSMPRFTADHRNRKVITTLWQGLASLIVIHKIDYIFCSASISIADGGQYALQLAALALHHHGAPPLLRVSPKSPPPALEQYKSELTVIPTQELKHYLRFGAMVCGEPNWNIHAQMAELLILLDCNAISKRYNKPMAEHI